MEKTNNTPLVIVVLVGLALSGISLSGGDNTLSDVSSTHDKTFEGQELSASEIQREIDTVKRRIAEVQEEIKKIEEEKDRSEYYGLVSLQFGGAWGGDSPEKEYLSISASSRLSEPLSLSGWSLKSDATGKSILFPHATTLYYPGVLYEETYPILFPQGKVIVNTGNSPVGVSFRTNICSGYLNQFNTFTPWISQQCPRLTDENLSSIPNTPKNDNCLNYIESLPSCQIPSRPITPDFSPECAYFLQEKGNYKGCVDIHRNDSDFFENEWRVFLGRSERMWKDNRETIRLIDSMGKTVAILTRN